MSTPYQPPYSITPAIVHLVARISEAVGRLSVLADAARELRLRRINRVRTLQGSLAIEGNTLTLGQITALLDGKRVIAPPREVLEARNAIAVYERFGRWRADHEADLLAAHGIMMSGLIDEAGMYRRSGAGVMGGDRVIHLAHPAHRVPALMADLFQWLADSQEHPLIASSVFHSKFEFIHPFADGNGQMGRLWQALILSRWNPLFADLPVESLVFAHQDGYYQAIQDSTNATDSAPFIEFMLNMLLEAMLTSAGADPADDQVADQAADQATDQVNDQVNDQVTRLIRALAESELGSRDLMKALHLAHRPTFRKNYLQPSLQGGWIEQTQPDAPSSPTQRYRLTPKGRRWLKRTLDNMER